MRFNIAVQAKKGQEITSDMFCQGQSDGSFLIDPVHPEDQNYWQGYQQEIRRYWIKKNNPMADEYEQKAYQGDLYATERQISKKYGDIWVIGESQDLKGWEIKINGLLIQILTFDWAEAELETKWAVYSHHPDALNLLGDVFGEEAVQKAIAKYAA